MFEKLKGQTGLLLPVIFAVVFVLIALSLATPIANQTSLLISNSSNTGGNISGAGQGLLSLTTTLYIVVIVVFIIAAMGAGI